MYGFDRRWLNKNAIVLFENIGMWKKMSGFVSLFLCAWIHSFVGLNGCSVLVCMWPCAIADIQHIDISSTWKRNSWQICHIIRCSVTRTARVWCGQWDKLWFSTLYSQNVGFWPKHTQKNTYKHWKRERERGRDTCKRCGSMAEIMSFQ